MAYGIQDIKNISRVFTYFFPKTFFSPNALWCRARQTQIQSLMKERVAAAKGAYFLSNWNCEKKGNPFYEITKKKKKNKIPTEIMPVCKWCLFATGYKRKNNREKERKKGTHSPKKDAA